MKEETLMKIFGVYIVSDKDEIILSVNNETDSISSFFPIKKDDPFITSSTLKYASKNPKHFPYKHEKKFYYGINDGTGNVYFLVSDVKDNELVKTLLAQIKEIDLTAETQQNKSIAIKNKISVYANETTMSVAPGIIFRDLKNRFNNLWS
ncbi:hypothetical protein [Legionella parisiensis]|uniref:Uncharacterized protein n=1 Tax=Legionella parisiensis TaxID=45071 RepID=A0A1E5JKT0_9GAMM|nr:hypothetical protein [Legionella parisiensis]KTD43077.1 hypothetical protein Lpar_1054 [Legionella parisiensis]OEH45156.1 hypothetical protein lpari_03926 [Legionella parisiensis]STX77844.1 Uncharacterised protein [Legionella parisiensis]